MSGPRSDTLWDFSSQMVTPRSWTLTLDAQHGQKKKKDVAEMSYLGSSDPTCRLQSLGGFDMQAKAS